MVQEISLETKGKGGALRELIMEILKKEKIEKHCSCPNPNKKEIAQVIAPSSHHDLLKVINGSLSGSSKVSRGINFVS